MKGRRIDSPTIRPPTVEPGDYGFSSAGMLWVKPPQAGIPSCNVPEERVIRHLRWPWQKRGAVTVRGVLTFWRGLAEERHLVWAGYLTRGDWRHVTVNEFARLDLIGRG